MSTEALKLELIECLLRTEDEGLLRQVAALFRAGSSSAADPLSDEHLSIVNERLAEYQRGEGKGYTWEEAKAMIRAGKGRDA